MFDHLKKVKDLNPEYNWELYQLALGDFETISTLSASSNNIGWNTLFSNQIPSYMLSNTFCVAIKRLDDCLGESHIKRVQLIKIDAEGYESKIIQGLSRFIDDHRVDHIILEANLHQWKSDLGLEPIYNMIDCNEYIIRNTRHPYQVISINQIEDGQNILLSKKNI